MPFRLFACTALMMLLACQSQDKQSPASARTDSTATQSVVPPPPRNPYANSVDLPEGLYFPELGDTINWPEYPQTGPAHRYQQPDLPGSPVLEVTRTGYRELDFRLLPAPGQQPVLSGQASLRKEYFLAVEIDEDEKGLAFPAYDYYFEADSCFGSIRISQEDGRLARYAFENCGQASQLSHSDYLLVEKE